MKGWIEGVLMTANDNTNQVEETPSGTPVPDQENPNAELRAHNKRLKAENQEYRQRILAGDLSAIGLNPTAGLGKAIAKEYDGEMTTEAVAAYARDEYQHETTTAAPLPPEVEAADRLDQAMQSSTPVVPVEPVPESQQFTERLDSNDPETTREDAISSIRAKSQQFQETFYQ